MGCRSLEGSGEKDGDHLWLPTICAEAECLATLASCLEASEMLEAEAARGHDAGDVGAVALAGEASSAFGLAVSSVVSLVLAPPMVSCGGGRIALPSMEHSTRCVTLRLFPSRSGLLMFFL